MKLVGRNSNNQDMCTWYLGFTVALCNICGMIICTYDIVFMYNFTWTFYMLCTLSEMTNKRWTIIRLHLSNQISSMVSSSSACWQITDHDASFLLVFFVCVARSCMQAIQFEKYSQKFCDAYLLKIQIYYNLTVIRKYPQFNICHQKYVIIHTQLVL